MFDTLDETNYIEDADQYLQMLQVAVTWHQLAAVTLQLFVVSE
jgi:hypothetical protein